MRETNHKGAIAETAITAEAIRLGIEVYRPVFDGGRFDLVFAFQDGRLARVQCKWASLCAGALRVRIYSASRAAEGMRIRPYGPGEIDAIAAYCSGNRRCYYIPAERLVGHKVMHLRLTPTRNRQEERVNWAADYELGAIAQLGERLTGSQEVGGSNPPSSIA
jgi:hypothetical protein